VCDTAVPVGRIRSEEHASYLDVWPYPFIAIQDQTVFKGRGVVALVSY